MVYIIKKDGTKEEFDASKIKRAVNKSAGRVMYRFTDDEINFICKYATDRAEAMSKERKGGILIQDMHNIVEGALEQVNPAVAKSYRDYRNYKVDFIHMMDEVYTKSQSIRYQHPVKYCCCDHRLHRYDGYHESSDTGTEPYIRSLCTVDRSCSILLGAGNDSDILYG